MKKILVLCLMISVMALALLGSTKTIAAQPDSEVKMAGQPSKWYFDQDNYLIIVPYQSTSFLRFGYQGKGFPDGTQTRVREIPDDTTGKPWLIEYSLPGKTWRPLLWSQLICKDEQCEETKPETEPEPEPEPESGDTIEPWRCDWRLAMASGAAGALIGYGIGSIESEADAGDAHAEVKGDPISGAIIGAIIGPFGYCSYDYLKWKEDHPGYKANGHKKE